MADPRETHYDVLGVAPGASPVEIQRAFDRFVAALGKAETPPDARREQRMREAHEVLSDPARRDAYDASLAAAAAGQAKRKRGTAFAIGSAVVAFVAGLAGWNSLKSSVSPTPAVPSRPVAEIVAEAGRALGRAEALDPSGQVTPLGFGAAVESGKFAVACPTLGGGAQIRVHNGPRVVSARVEHRDESLGLCRLAVEGGGAASPLPVAGAAPVPGEKVLAATLDAAGEARLLTTKVSRVWTEGARTLIETDGAAPDAQGGVLLDVGGRVLGIASGAGPAYYAVPRAFPGAQGKP